MYSLEEGGCAEIQLGSRATARNGEPEPPSIRRGRARKKFGGNGGQAVEAFDDRQTLG